MSNRNTRWNWLTIFAACNLACWIAVAVAVGVMASDVVDLGVESFVRERQATLVAMGEQPPPRPPSNTPRPPAGSIEQPIVVHTVIVQVEATSTAGRPSPSAPSATPRLQMTSYATERQMTPHLTTGAPTQLPPTGESTPQPVEPAGDNPLPRAEEPTVIVASSPLLLADPDMDSLMQLDAELRRSAVGRAVQIRYREAALNREIAALLASYPDLPYQNVRVDLQRGGVTLTGDVTVLGLEVSTEVKGRVVARDCLPQIEIDSVSISGLMTPGFVKEEVRAIIQESMAWYPPDYPLCLEQIVLEEDRATIYGSRR